MVRISSSMQPASRRDALRRGPPSHPTIAAPGTMVSISRRASSRSTSPRPARSAGNSWTGVPSGTTRNPAPLANSVLAGSTAPLRDTTPMRNPAVRGGPYSSARTVPAPTSSTSASARALENTAASVSLASAPDATVDDGGPVDAGDHRHHHPRPVVVPGATGVAQELVETDIGQWCGMQAVQAGGHRPMLARVDKAPFVHTLVMRNSHGCPLSPHRAAPLGCCSVPAAVRHADEAVILRAG